RPSTTASSNWSSKPRTGARCRPSRIFPVSTIYSPQAPARLNTSRKHAMASNRSSKVIITCAVTGAVHTPSMSEYLPLTPDQIVQNAVDAANAGAAIVHLHARDPSDGRPTPDPAVFDQIRSEEHTSELQSRENIVCRLLLEKKKKI